MAKHSLSKQFAVPFRASHFAVGRSLCWRHRWRTFHCSLPISNRYSIVAVCHALHDVCLSTGKKNHIALARLASCRSCVARADHMCAVLNAIVDTPVVFFSPVEWPKSEGRIACNWRFKPLSRSFREWQVTPADNTRPIINRKYKESIGEM